MKRLFAVILLIALMACTLVIPAAAATFEWPMEVEMIFLFQLPIHHMFPAIHPL